MKRIFATSGPTKRINKELNDLEKSLPTDNIVSISFPDDDDMFRWNVVIKGPDNSPYKDAFFTLYVRLPTDYPFKPPTFILLDKIFHPNIIAFGDHICISILHSGWSPAITVEKVVFRICDLLVNPDLKEKISTIRGAFPTNPEATSIFQEDRKRYDDTVRSYVKNNQKKWTEKGFIYEEAKEWIEVGLTTNELTFANYLKKERGLTPQLVENRLRLTELRNEYNWLKKGFTLEQRKEWITAGAEAYDHKFVVWLRDTKNYTPEWITNYKENYEELSNRFKKYDLCSECRQPNTGEQWCKDCNAKHLFPALISNNPWVNEFILNYQLEATEANKFIEWIPYEQFSEIEYIAEGGFGKVYKAKWREGNILYWDSYKNQWQRDKDHYYEKEKDRWGDNKKTQKYKDYREVVLKSLNNSSNNTDFLQETEKHKIIDDWFQNIVPCYGLSQDPETGNYLMVMKYIEGGDLRKYLKSKNLTFQEKLKRLTNIIQGLKDVHSKNLVHRDFHSGNILNSEIQSFVTDLGLCKPVNEINQQEEIFGVMPYVAPEILRKKGYTPASDIYSLGMVAYEIFANQSPYLDKEYDTLLAVEICQGLRPEIDKLKIPQVLENLIKQCWDNDPAKRPTANEIERTLRNWQQDSNFRQRIQTIEEKYNQIFQNAGYKSHPTATMNSKLINTKEITRILSQSQEVISSSIYIKDTSDLDSCLINVEQDQEVEQEAKIIHNPPKNN